MSQEPGLWTGRHKDKIGHNALSCLPIFSFSHVLQLTLQTVLSTRSWENLAAICISDKIWPRAICHLEALSLMLVSVMQVIAL